MVDKRIHIDTLEYTRSGLRTKAPIELEVDEHNRVVLVRPDRQPSVTATFGGFGENCSFPGAAILSCLLHPHRGGGRHQDLGAWVDGGARLQIFAHTDAVGSEADNKQLSDRRAQAVYALLRGDTEAMLQVSEAEGWGVEVHQLILRALDCDPGPIDGVLGELTVAAVESFQSRYRERSFHRDGTAPIYPDLVVDGELGADTQAALVDAYLGFFSPRFGSEAFVSAAPANGCVAYNPALVPDNTRNRRASLVVHQADPAYPEATPCTEGDHMACPVVSNGEPHLCMWFREHVVEEDVAAALHYHFLPSWLPLPNGNYLLSVLTTVPDGEALEFQMMACKEPADGIDLPDPSFHLHDIGEPIVHRPTRGVAQVVWSPPPDF